jgi:hypothetical protein
MASGTATSAASRTAVVSKRVMASPREPGEHASGGARVHRAPRPGEPYTNYDNGMARRDRPSVGSSGAEMRAGVPRERLPAAVSGYTCGATRVSGKPTRRRAEVSVTATNDCVANGVDVRGKGLLPA